MSKNLAWILIIIGGVCEIFWVSGLKYAHTLPLQILTGVGISISFVCMLGAIKVLEISVAYSVFVGIGAAGIVLAEIALFGEQISAAKILLIIALMSGVLGLKYATSTDESTHSKNDASDKGA